MIVCSIHDPAIFQPGCFVDNPGYERLVSEHLDTVAFQHLLVCDRQPGGGSYIWEEINRAAESNPLLYAKFSSYISNQRIVYLPPLSSRSAQVKKQLASRGSVETVGLIGHGNVDVLVAAPETLKAMAEENMNTQRVFTMDNYHLSDAKSKENLARGGRPVSGLNRDEFLSLIIKPVVCWAENVYLIDKMVTRAAFGEKGNGKPQGNWQKFKYTIGEIYRLWNEGAKSVDGCFEIVSIHNGYRVGDELAALLAEMLELQHRNIKISLKSEPDLSAVNHDRYLVTNQEFQLGFTRGFDLLDSEKPCVSDVYLRQPCASDDVIPFVLRAHNVGQWDGRLHHS